MQVYFQDFPAQQTHNAFNFPIYRQSISYTAPAHCNK
jgi:hypothetical protein